MYIYEDPWHLKASQLKPRARNSPLINVFIQQHVQALVCPLFSNCPFWRCCYALNSYDAHCFYFCCRENNGAYFHFARKGRNMWFKIWINTDLNLVPEINMCKGGEKKQLSGGNQKWSMKLMKQQCHRLIQLSFQFPWQSSVIVPTIFSAEKFLWNCYQCTGGSIASGSSMHCYSKKEAASRLQKGRPAEILQIKRLTC